jgi:hypothetical protein
MMSQLFGFFLFPLSKFASGSAYFSAKERLWSLEGKIYRD